MGQERSAGARTPPGPPPGMHQKGKGPQRKPQRRLGRRLEEVAEAVGGGYCRLQMPSRLAFGVRGTGVPSPFQCIPWPSPLYSCARALARSPAPLCPGADVARTRAELQYGLAHLTEFRPRTAAFASAVFALAALNRQIGGDLTLDDVESYAPAPGSAAAQAQARVLLHKRDVTAEIAAAVAALDAFEAHATAVAAGAEALRRRVAAAAPAADRTVAAVAQLPAAAEAALGALWPDGQRAFLRRGKCGPAADVYRVTLREGLCSAALQELQWTAAGELLVWAGLGLALAATPFAWKFLYRTAPPKDKVFPEADAEDGSPELRARRSETPKAVAVPVELADMYVYACTRVYVCGCESVC